MSTFYKSKIAGHGNFGERLEFGYQSYSLPVITAYLDFVYAIPTFQDDLNLSQKLELMKFLFFEGKTQTSGKV